MTELTIERLREVLSYDPDTGVFTRLKSLTHNAREGSVAGSLKSSGYMFIDVDNVRYRAHRLAWFYMTGEMPSQMVDHRDNVRSNNRWSNLRLANNQQNGANSKAKRFNTSGFKGVYWHKKRELWAAKINVGKRQIYLGCFNFREDAAAAYLRAACEHFGEFARAS